MTSGFWNGDVAFSSADDTWTTPRDLFDELNREFNFVLDAAALKSSALCLKWYGPDHDDETMRDALSADWVTDSAGGVVFFNPPYGRQIGKFMEKANREARRGAFIVSLIPSRTDTNWWHEFVIHWEIRFIRGRLKFGNLNNPAPFASAIVVMNGRSENSSVFARVDDKILKLFWNH